MFGRTSSSRFLVSGSLCGVYSRVSSFLIFLKNSSQGGNVVLAQMFASVSPKVRGWMKGFLVDVLMICTGLVENSNFLAIVGEEPSPASSSCGFGALGDFLVEGFFRGIVPAIKIAFKHVYRAELGREHKRRRKTPRVDTYL
jgi:hypothetical protein